MSAAVRFEPPATGETVLVVPGMHCAGCMAKVERGLAALPAVHAARVNLTARQVAVSHDPALAPPVLIEALARIGFPAQPRSPELAPPPSAARPLLAPLGVAAFAAMNVMLLSVSIWSGAEGPTRELFHWLSALIGVPAILYAGRVFFVSAWSALRRGRTNMDVPISIGVSLATGLSLYETATGGADAWFDGTLMLLLFLLAGRTLDAAMRDRARAGVDALLRQAAPGALVLGKDGTLAWVAASDLLPGMIMRVAAGERLAADGEIVTGQSRFDNALLTGESIPVSGGPGAAVHAGTLNLDAPVDVRIAAAGQGTTLAEIARLMGAAGQARSRYVRIADRASRLYAPAVHTLAALSFAWWMIQGAGLHQSLVIAIAVLIITCPCALGLAVPVAQVVACGALMRQGVMVKDGSALERLESVDRALLDKTGTLTGGRPVPDPASLAALDPAAAQVALALASHSRHPLSRALIEALTQRGVSAAILDDVVEEAGNGVRGQWQGRTVALRRPEAGTGMATVLDMAGEPARLIGFADRLRPDTPEALAELAELGIASSILSGDNPAAVREVAAIVRLDSRAAASPVDKLAAIRALQDQGHRVLMVGDGLNDGPALAAADASMAPGTASDVGRQAADFVFLGEAFTAVPRTVRAARRTMRVVRQNFVLAIGYNVLAVPLAMAGLVTPLIAAAAMSLSSLIVIANSLRLTGAAK
ncbi:cadmium-translocating P-type ATPase [Novosphingobium flavum]|uniref:Cadmium-translocating P-type ATPase n=1 Tax=Novosphingobium aerophilum TaxID=2839843 RepID=A0A7X1F879_9SPHN|nr:heavy metal translocating P-type ATPase [Novosphingobium aerophilum]MBC2652183.1 cadmium-translocating P-type ATPase [Novosphingobium aerophilum]MBC2661138.1 cadmium-translocating P-type ATPase [Novosphingobium aerophilum]